jgi:hypothetical protein
MQNGGFLVGSSGFGIGEFRAGCRMCPSQRRATMKVTEHIAIEVGRKRVRAIRVAVVRQRLTVLGAFTESIPTKVDPQDAAAFGSWLASRLEAADFPRGRTVAVLPRDSVALKRLSLPSTDARELPEMTRLAMQQELSADMIVDFVPLSRSETSTSVLAVCSPQASANHLKAIGRAAKINFSRVSVSTFGTVALLEDIHQRESSVVFAADVSGDSIEVVTVNGSGLLASRVEEVPAPGDELSMAEAIMTGLRRAWMSHGMGAEIAPDSLAVLMGRRRVCEYAVGPVAQMIDAEARVTSEHPRIDGRSVPVDEYWPLLGALLEPALNRPMINLALPRRAPDERAAKRRRWLMAAGLLLVIGMGLYTLANRELQTLRAEAQRLSQARGHGAADYLRYVRDTYRLKHLRQWESIGVDWLGHADYLSRIAPGPEAVVLDRWTGSLATNGVQYERKSRTWTAPRQVTIVIDGEARNRETADAFRETLVQNSLYSTTTTGADARGGKRMPFGFTYRLRTQSDAPGASVSPSVNDSDVKAKHDAGVEGDAQASSGDLALSHGATP